MSEAPVVEARSLEKRFGGLVAVDEYDLRLERGDLVGLIGPNGAGKTTAYNLLTGVLKPSAGRISLSGRDMTGAAPYLMARAGLARTFQNIRLFSDLSVVENVMCGGHTRLAASTVATMLQLPSFWRAEERLRQTSQEIVERIGLAELAGQRAGDLSYGDQRRVEIGRALAGQPQVLLLDEPAAGLNPSETRDLVSFIRQMNEESGIAVLVVEHDMHLVMDLCKRIQVLNRGKLIAEGTPEEVQGDAAVIEAYLGAGRKERAHA
ncbi:ABC transporter ATP-binding protein [Chelativorans sp. YIM 93263]|uniref:ABC transporter ATP-binding protein n=1 Tax=Chelativorans sp. YIM 93263 TaxID=2906648 RepID=UPI002379D98F|nr:ABC transporter ATP-binding protein [Chelativorans sp. YIM 93263]